jgi:glycosyltransferase involved in cell wall biosynthesis
VAAVRARRGLPERYVLSVGTIEPRKNLATAIAAFHAAAPRGVALALVGPRGWKLAEAIGADLAAGAVRPGIVVTGAVEDDELPALYAGASAFLFPSLYEGFGFPVLEAMACGTPVLSSDASSLAEVLGDAGVLLPPRDVAAWAEALRALLADPTRGRELGERGRRRAAEFTWERTARATRAVYEGLDARRP